MKYEQGQRCAENESVILIVFCCCKKTVGSHWMEANYVAQITSARTLKVVEKEGSDDSVYF